MEKLVNLELTKKDTLILLNSLLATKLSSSVTSNENCRKLLKNLLDEISEKDKCEMLCNHEDRGKLDYWGVNYYSIIKRYNLPYILGGE